MVLYYTYQSGLVMSDTFDLLSLVEQGGCSAKLPAHLLQQIIHQIPKLSSENLLVGTDTSDDAAVWKINSETALIQTTDFFPPLCSSSYEFGQIAAANALSDVFAMGGEVLTVLNLVMFPSTSIPIEELKEILRGGAEKIIEAGGFLAGGHTIDDEIPKYGLAVTGVVHPDRIIANDRAQQGDYLVLTKPIGSGAILAAHRLGLVSPSDYQFALDNMKVLNRSVAQIMQKHQIKCCTDITGFGLLGHAMHIANASKVQMEFYTREIPFLPSAFTLIDDGCIPCGAFKNLDYVSPVLDATSVGYSDKMICCDAQTSGGILMCVPGNILDSVLTDLKSENTPCACVVGKIVGDGYAKITLLESRK